MVQKIKTNIKFQKGLNNVDGRLYGFVTKTNGSWRGCRESDLKKRIVLVDAAISKDIVPNILYHCTLVPMYNGNGFIATAAKLVQFKGTISTVYRNKVYLVKVTFGNRTIIYDPSSKSPRLNDIKKIAELIRNRIDLENAQCVAEDFIDNACMIKRLYDQFQSHV